MYNYSEHKRVGDTWVSQPFYTRTEGYKLNLEVDANGFNSGTGTHVGVTVFLMKGEHDESLQWPFSSKITIQLLNWREDKGNVEKTVDYNIPTVDHTRLAQQDTDSRWGKPEFISHSDLEYNANYNTEFINDDKLCFVVSKVTIIDNTNINY